MANVIGMLCWIRWRLKKGWRQSTSAFPRQDLCYSMTQRGTTMQQAGHRSWGLQSFTMSCCSTALAQMHVGAFAVGSVRKTQGTPLLADQMRLGYIFASVYVL